MTITMVERMKNLSVVCYKLKPLYEGIRVCFVLVCVTTIICQSQRVTR